MSVSVQNFCLPLCSPDNKDVSPEYTKVDHVPSPREREREIERERERERERETERQRDRDRETETETERERQRESTVCCSYEIDKFIS